MARKPTIGKRLRQALEAPLMRLGLAVVPRLPRGAVRALARGLGTAAYAVSARSRRLGRENLDLAFGGTKTAAEKRRILRRSLQNFSLVMLDLLWFTRDSAARMERWFVPAPGFRETMAGRTARVGVTGHFGNWEVLGYMVGALGIRTYAVARPIDNPYIDRWLLRHREETGQCIISKFGAADLAVRVIEQQSPLCFVADQHAGSKGIWVDFFGRPASTYKSIALLAMQMNCPIAVGGAWRLGNRFKFRTSIVDVIDPQDYADDKDAVRSITVRYTKALEKLILNAPQQYLWMHRRWREPPPPRKKKQAATVA